LIREKTGIKIEKKILKYDGRTFLSDELREEIRIKGSAELSAVAQRDKDNKVLKDPKLVGKIIYKIVTERADFNQGTGGYTKPIKSGDIVRIDEHYLQ